MQTNKDSGTQRNVLLGAIAIWEGRLTNRRLRELFNLSSVRASEWIREFRDSHKNWLRQDTKTKSFLATPHSYEVAERQGTEDALSHYLDLVGIPTHPAPGQTPRAMWAAFPDLSPPKPRIFAAISKAIADQRDVRITYRSMAEPTPHHRTLTPHNIVRAGRRWHVRAYCAERDDFRDFTLRRIEAIEPLDSHSGRSETDDVAWQTLVKVRLQAHPILSIPQQELIRFEYFNGTAARVDTCRAALVAYFIQDVRAAIDPVSQLPPDYQLVVENRDEIKEWLFP